ncbi:MAG: hypothetical protein OSA89_16330 [Mariniblastus sp.]|nr:hypothetical protein [Mariniblastus sp.]
MMRIEPFVVDMEVPFDRIKVYFLNSNLNRRVPDTDTVECVKRSGMFSVYLSSSLTSASVSTGG